MAQWQLPMIHLNYDQDYKPEGFIITNGTTKVKGISRFIDHVKALEKVSGKNVEIGDFTIIEMPVKIGNNVIIGDYCKIKAGVTIPDNAVIEDGSIIHN